MEFYMNKEHLIYNSFVEISGVEAVAIRLNAQQV